VFAVILKEVSVERLAFTCDGCGRTWSVDYDVQHVEDGHGHDRDYYFHDQVPCPDPTAPGAVLCPTCGRAHVVVELTARRASPAVTDTAAGDLGTRPDAGKVAARPDAPLRAAAAGAPAVAGEVGS
jgi:hypothetical protein